MSLRGESLNWTFVDEIALSGDTSVDEQKSQLQIEDVECIQKLLKDGQWKQVKSIIRSNDWPVDHPIRQSLWPTLCQNVGGGSKNDATFYQGLVNELFGQVSRPPNLPNFCDPIYCDSFYLNTEGHETAERILFVIAYNDPSITYSPLLYPLTCLFLHYMSEEETYVCINCLLTAKRAEFVTQNKLAHEANSFVAMKLTKKYAKQGFIQLQEIKKNPDAMFKAYKRWLCWLFKGLPFFHLVRVVDCFLLEGSKVLFRTLLSILMCLSKYSGASSKSSLQINTPCRGLTQRIFDYAQNHLGPVDKFLKVTFGIRGLSRTEIQKCLVKAESELQSQAFHHDRFITTDLAPSTDSLYQIYMCSASLTVKEMNLSSERLVKTGSTGMIPFKNFQSDILTADQMSILWTWIPTRITMLQPHLLYSTNEHGSSLTSLFMRVDDWEPTILVIKAMNDEIFGAYCSTNWAVRLEQDESGEQYRYFGTGETFLFSMWPKTSKYSWVGVDATENVGPSEELFMAADKQFICIGAGNGRGLWLDESLTSGKTEGCDTFCNQSLCNTSDFTCKVVEVIGFE